MNTGKILRLELRAYTEDEAIPMPAETSWAGGHRRLVRQGQTPAKGCLVAATKIWRRMYESEEQLSRDGLAFMKAEYEKRWG